MRVMIKFAFPFKWAMMPCAPGRSKRSFKEYLKN